MATDFEKWKIVFLRDNRTLEDRGCYIISCNYQESLFDKYSSYSFLITFNGIIFSKFEPVNIYYGDELQMQGIIKRPMVTPFSNESIIEVYPITYFLTIQGMNTQKTYTENNFINHILAVLQDNLDGSRISTIQNYKSIIFDQFEIGIIPPLKNNFLQTNMSDEQSEKKTTTDTKLFNYIEKLANQNKVHITTLIYKNNTFLYFLDNASIVQKNILNYQIPIIKTDDLVSNTAFNIKMKEEVMFEELTLYSEGSFYDNNDVGSKTTYKVDYNKLFNKELSDTAIIQDFFKSALNIKYKDYQKKQTLLEQADMLNITKFIVENTLASGLAITISIKNFTASNGVPFLIGSFIDISDLFIKGNITTKIISSKAFVITGKTFRWDKDGFIQDIILAPSFILEN